MYPYLFGLRTYTFIYVASMIVLCVVAIVLCRRRGVSPVVGVLMGLAYAFGMVVGATFLYDGLRGEIVWRNYLSPSYYIAGGMFGGPLAYLAIVTPAALLFARDRRRALDLIALSLPAAMIVAKLACVANGCCYGRPSDVPWALSYPPGAEAPAGIARHPTPLYEIAVLLIIVAVLSLPAVRRRDGLMLPVFVAIYGSGRALTEIFRGDDRPLPFVGPLTASQATCLGASAAALIVFLTMARRSVPAYSSELPDPTP